MKILEIYQFFFITGLGFTGLNLLILAIIMLALRANQKMYTEYFKDRSMANRAKPRWAMNAQEAQEYDKLKAALRDTPTVRSGGPIGRLLKTPQAPIDKEKAAFTNPALGKTWPSAVQAAKALNEAVQTPQEAADCPDCPGIPKGLDKCDECEVRAQEEAPEGQQCPNGHGLLFYYPDDDGMLHCHVCTYKTETVEKPWDANECPVCLGLLCKSGAAQAECPGDIQCPDCEDRCPACNGTGQAS